MSERLHTAIKSKGLPNAHSSFRVSQPPACLGIAAAEPPLCNYIRHVQKTLKGTGEGWSTEDVQGHRDDNPS